MRQPISQLVWAHCLALFLFGIVSIGQTICGLEFYGLFSPWAALDLDFLVQTPQTLGPSMTLNSIQFEVLTLDRILARLSGHLTGCDPCRTSRLWMMCNRSCASVFPRSTSGRGAQQWLVDRNASMLALICAGNSQ